MSPKIQLREGADNPVSLFSELWVEAKQPQEGGADEVPHSCWEPGSVWVTRHLECRCVQLWAPGDRDEGIDPE